MVIAKTQHGLLPCARRCRVRKGWHCSYKNKMKFLFDWPALKPGHFFDRIPFILRAAAALAACVHPGH